MKHALIFTYDKETKGAHRYREVSVDGNPIPVDSPADSHVLGQLYIRKAALPGAAPNTLAVTLEY